jgi:glycerophosphoryl diester phosphodiesterase
MIKGLPGRAWADLRFHARRSFTFQLLVQLATLAATGPLLAWAIRRLVLLTGEPVVTNFDIPAFVLSPGGVAVVLSSVMLSGAALLAEFAGQSWIAGHAIARRRVSLGSTMIVVVRRWPALMLLAGRIFWRLLLLALPCLLGAIVVWYWLLRAHDINFYLDAQPPEWRRGLALMAILTTVCAALVVWQLGRWVFTVPILVYEDLAPAQALRESARRTRGHLGQILTPLLSWALLVWAAGISIARITRPAEAAALQWAGMDFSRVLPLTAVFAVVGLALALLQHAAWIAGHQFLVTRMYAEQRGLASWQIPPGQAVDRQDPPTLKAAVLIGTCVLLACGFGAAWFVASRPVPEPVVAITAHRGDSSHAPENTLAAFRAAMEAHATYAELDTQRTRDGQVVVLHDRDLMRMAGDARRIGELSMADLAAIDVGLRYGPAFTGERVPSLETVIDLVRGHMKLNVELKYNAPDPQLAAAVVDVLRRNDFLDAVVISSLNAAALREIKAIEPRLRTGQIVTAAVGDVTRADSDFLSLNSARATAAVVRRAHAAGKEVHVWTVNRPEVMLRMIERGVDNIITDDPALAMRVLRQLRALDPAERLALRLRVLFSSSPPETFDPHAVAPL